MAEPKELVDRLEQGAELPSGNEERFAGYGVMGVPFTSGDLLAMRRFPASSLGQGYTSVWHRDPQGRWTFYSDVPPQLACSRYFGSAISEAVMRRSRSPGQALKLSLYRSKRTLVSIGTFLRRKLRLLA